MKIGMSTRLHAALDRRGLDPNVKRSIINDVFSPASALAERLKREENFDALRDDLRAVLRSTQSNRTKWPPELVHLYEQYLAVVRTALNTVDYMRTKMLPDPANPQGPRIPATLARTTERMRVLNEKHRAKGEPLEPACNANWVSWVDPNKRDALIADFSMAYVRMGRGKGRRFIPFATTAVSKDMQRAITRHRRFIEDQRDVVSDRPNNTGSTHYRALHLCALRMAEMWLDSYERDIKSHERHPATHPVPVNWMHLLTKEMRERIRAADEDPASVSPMGLASFYNPKEAHRDEDQTAE